jgi:hypothetical protein
MRTFLMIAGPFWFTVAVIFLSSLLVSVLKRMPSPPWDSGDGYDLADLEDSPAPFGLTACVD